MEGPNGCAASKVGGEHGGREGEPRQGDGGEEGNAGGGEKDTVVVGAGKEQRETPHMGCVIAVVAVWEGWRR